MHFFDPKPVGYTLHPYHQQGVFSDFGSCFAPGDEIIVSGGRAARAIFYSLVNLLRQGYYANIEDDLKNILPVSFWYYSATNSATATADGLQIRLQWTPKLNV